MAGMSADSMLVVPATEAADPMSSDDEMESLDSDYYSGESLFAVAAVGGSCTVCLSRVVLVCF